MQAYRKPILPPVDTPLMNQYKLYNSGVQQNAEDYHDIMGGYKNLIAQVGNNASPRGTFQPLQTQPLQNTSIQGPQQISAAQYDYNPTAAVTSSIANLGELSQTGGYSQQGIADLRERGLSPIRSVYANANREMERGRALSGGYSPNMNATRAKMAREQSGLLAGQVTNVNAGIAQNVAQNKLSVAPQYASAAQRDSETRGMYGSKNTDAINRANEINAANATKAGQDQLDLAKFNTGNAMDMAKFNSSGQMDMLKFNEALRSGDQTKIMQALEGMKSLYGTTPALANLFGDQAMQHAQFGNQVTQQNKQAGLDAVGKYLARSGR